MGINEEYMHDVRKQAQMLLDINVSNEEYFEFKINRLKKHGIISPKP